MSLRISLLIMGILSQHITALAGDERNPDPNPWSAKVQYVGEFVLHPGIAMGTDYTLKSNSWFNLHWDTEIGGYVHKRNNNALFLQSTLGTRYTTRFAVFADIQAGIGYMLSMPDGDVYRVDEQGTVNPGGRPLTSHFKPTFSLLFGWDGTRNRDIPWRVFTGLEAYMQSAYNHVMLPHVAFRLGVSYQL